MLNQLGGVPVIDYWLLTAHQSKRLQPLEDNLYIVANKDNIDEFEVSSPAANTKARVRSILTRSLLCSSRAPNAYMSQHKTALPFKMSSY